VYEAQVSEYLRRFVIPEDYQARILALYRHLDPAMGDSESMKRELEGRLERIRKLYEWGDKPEEEYLAESREIKEELSHITPEEQRPDILAQLQRFLVDVSAAWEAASQEQRNRLARQLFDIVWVKEECVVAVRPRPELRPFFQISEECQHKSLSGDPDRIRTGDLQLDTVLVFVDRRYNKNDRSTRSDTLVYVKAGVMQWNEVVG